MEISKELVLDALKRIINPETDKDIVSSGMVKDINYHDTKLIVEIELDKPNSPIKNSLERVIKDVINTVISKALQVEVVINVRKNETKNEGVEIANPLPLVTNIIAVASGKGGVGKSTIATNLAIALAKTGASVGLLDADIFGPSLPKMFNAESERPLVKKIGGKDVIIPIEKYGVKMLSIGFFVDPENALIWRAPMANGALLQLINDTAWGKLDHLLIDLPPGTSDIHLTLVQTVPITGAVIVTTPQQVALLDAKKGIGMFRSEKINVPILGIVENMSWFTPAELPNNKYYIFGKNGAKDLAEKYNVPILGQIPLIQSICESGDSGLPSVLKENSIESESFILLAKNVLKSLEERKTKLAPSQKVAIDPNAGCSK